MIDINELQIAITKQDKLLHSGPILPYMNDDGKTRVLAKDFDCAPTHNIFARSVLNFLFCNNEIVNYLITDEFQRIWAMQQIVFHSLQKKICRNLKSLQRKLLDCPDDVT